MHSKYLRSSLTSAVAAIVVVMTVSAVAAIVVVMTVFASSVQPQPATSAAEIDETIPLVVYDIPLTKEVAFEPTEVIVEEEADEAEEVEAVVEEAESYEEVYYETSYYESQYYEPQYYSSYDNDFKSAGVVYGDDGTRYTWYSQNVLPGGGLTELNNNGRHVNDSGYVCDGDGYIAIASSDHEQGTIIETPFGTGKVYDSGCASGTIDVYTDF